MQFSCESCKASLQIADEKVRGKRLIVRCKRCGAKITISDPALAVAAPRPTPAAVAKVPAAAPAPKRAPQPEPQPELDHPDSDTESTRAMESDVLEKALRASKADDASAMAMAPVSPNGKQPASRPPPPPPAIETPPPAAARDPAIWFAMLGGKQTGPLSRAELGLRTAQGQVGPRTYLWKEGMGSWQRAKDVDELSSLFGAPPAPARPPPPPPPVPPPPPAMGIGEFNTGDFGNLDVSGELKKATEAAAGSIDVSSERNAPPVANEPLKPVKLGSDDGEDHTSVDPLPLGERVHQEDVAKELFHTDESGQSAVDLARWASSELGKKKDSSPNLLKAPQPDPFAAVPSSPEAVEPKKEEVTGEVLKSAGVKKSRAPMVIFVVVVVLAAAALLVYALAAPGPAERSEAAPPSAPVPVQTAQKPALGGSGDTSVTGLAARTEPAAPADATKAAARPARPEQPRDALSPDQEKAMKDLDNERGVGSHGPATAPAGAPEAAEPAQVGLTAAQVLKKLSENKGALQACIDEALRREPNLRVGKIHIATTIAPSGAVTSAKIDKRTVDESPLGGCLKRATKRIVFPTFAGDPFDVDIPIVVTAGE